MKCVLRNILEFNAKQKQIYLHRIYNEQSKENYATIQKWSVFFFKESNDFILQGMLLKHDSK